MDRKYPSVVSVEISAGKAKTVRALCTGVSEEGSAASEGEDAIEGFRRKQGGVVEDRRGEVGEVREGVCCGLF